MNNPDWNETIFTGDEVAVIGMAGRFPGARNLREFWQNLSAGKETVKAFTPPEMLEAGVDPELLQNPYYVKSMGILDDELYQAFDATLFEYTPKEVEMMDPQMRVVHECLYEALEDAGYAPGKNHGPVGVFAGGSSNFYWELLVACSEGLNLQRMFEAEKLSDKDFAATRLSYKFNLKGPSIWLFTACSGSLVAIHLACQSLVGGECNMALAGGVSVVFPHQSGYLYQKGMIASPDGHCRAFDARAEGTVRGNGAGIVVLKLLADALRDGDHIYAVVRGSAVNNDGNEKVGYTAPSVAGQMRVVKDAQLAAGVAPESITYIEAHGTGTQIGDPIEIEALTGAFHTRQKNYCRIGSVKTNIGHLDAAAGVAGFIKTVLMLDHRQIVPSLHFNQPNPKIHFGDSPFTVSTVSESWDSPNGPRIAGVSSFGIGGTNVHCVLEEAPDNEARGSEKPYNLLVFAARTPKSLEMQLQRYQDYFRNIPADVNLSDVAFTLQTGRRFCEYRKAFVCTKTDDIPKRLSEAPIPVEADLPPGSHPAIIFYLPELKWKTLETVLEIGREVAVFQAEIDRCLELFDQKTGRDLGAYLRRKPEDEAQPLPDAETVRVLTLMVEYSLGAVMAKLGTGFAAFHGRGTGAIAASCLAGSISIEDAFNHITGMSMAESGRGPLSEPKMPICSGDMSLITVGGRPAGNTLPGWDGTDKVMTIKEYCISDTRSWWETLARLWEMGVELDFNFLYKQEFRRRVSLPTYTFDRKRYWSLAERNGGLLRGILAGNMRAGLAGISGLETPDPPDGSDMPDPAETAAWENPFNVLELTRVTEHRLAAIFQDVLGYDRVGREDDFFKLGGDSVKAITLIAALEKNLGIPIPARQLVETPTIREIALYIHGHKQNTFKDDYVAYNKGESVAVFCFPPYLCIGLAYYEFCQHIYDYACYCFNYSVTDRILEYFSELIPQLRPKPPYVIFAYSAGARVAYQVIRCLEQKGCRVSDFIILDGFSRWKTPEQYSEAVERKRSRQLLINYDQITRSFGGNDQIIGDLVEKIISYSKLNCQIKVDQPLRANIHLIKAEPMVMTEENADWYEFTLNNSWEQFTGGIYREYQGAGEHLEMFNPAYIRANALIVKSILDGISPMSGDGRFPTTHCC
jgi:3-oxoacyl-(acyl-carrier-protein) synthase/thioesterase domain-containing protein/acyl carrier protein